MGVSENSGTPKSSIFIGFSIIFTIDFGVPLFLETTKYSPSHFLGGKLFFGPAWKLARSKWLWRWCWSDLQLQFFGRFCWRGRFDDPCRKMPESLFGVHHSHLVTWENQPLKHWQVASLLVMSRIFLIFWGCFKWLWQTQLLLRVCHRKLFIQTSKYIIPKVVQKLDMCQGLNSHCFPMC